MRTYAKNIADAPKQENMIDRRFWRRRRSLFNWRYLYNYLKAQVGRKWDDIWSDIAAMYDIRNYSDAEFRKQIKDEVYFDVTLDEKGMYDRVGGNIRACGRAKYYVDLNDGILKILPQDKRYRYTPPKSKIVRFNGFEYYKHDGIWYEVVSKPLSEIHRINLSWMPEYNHRYIYKDSFGNEIYDCSAAYNESVALVSKRQVGKKVVRRINDFLERNYYD